MFKKSNKDNGEKIFRYSIRKYHFGAASVAVAALMFFANGVQAQVPAVSSATASDVVAGSSGNSEGEPQESDGEEPEKVSQTEPSAELKSTGESNIPETKAEDASKGQEIADLAPAKPEAKPAAQETSQGGAVKEQDQAISAADTTVAKSTQGTLEALLANLTLDSMKALHAEVEEALAKAKVVLENPNATQVQVNEQVRLMEDLIRRVNQALNPSLPSSTVSGEASLTNHGLTAPEGAVTEQSTGGKRRKRGNLSQATPVVAQTSPETGGNSEKTESSETPSRQELPTYTNQGDGAYKLKDELEFIYKRLQKEGAEESKIQAAKAAADKFNEAFSKGETINQEDFDAALVDLKKSRDLIEGVLENKYGEDATTRRVTIEPRDGGEELPSRGRGRRVVRATRDGLNDYNTSREYYFEDDNKGGSPYVKYTYIFHSRRQRGVYDNVNRAVKDTKNYIYANVTSTVNGFRWDLYFNQGHNTLVGNPFWFTVPKDQTYINGTATLTRQFFDHDRNVIRGEESHSPNVDSIDAALRQGFAGFSDVAVGNNSRSGARKRGVALTEQLNVGSLNDLARQSNRGLYDRRLEKGEDAKRSDAKFAKINSTDSNLYYFTLPDTKDSYHLSFETRGTNDIRKLAYAVGSKGKDKEGNIYTLYLANQWYAVTYEEAKQGAKDDIEQARKNKNNNLGNNRNLSSVERDGAIAKVNIYARQATDKITKAQNIGQVENALDQGLSDIRHVNPVGRELPKRELDRKANEKKNAIKQLQHLTDEEKAEATRQVDQALAAAKTKVDAATTNDKVEAAKNEGLNALGNINPTPAKHNEAYNQLDSKANEKKNAIKQLQHLTDEEKAEATRQVDQALAAAKTKVDAATTNDKVEAAKNEGLNALDKILEDLSTRINQGNSSTPGNGGNQAGSDSRGDTASQGDRPAPSDDGSQGDANNQDQPTTPSTPDHSGDSTDQATGPSAQQRGTGNSTEAESSQGLSESSATAPARSRRSVAFAGGAQSSQEKQVDKSVLSDLIQDLETRLKDLDGIDQSVIDAAKVILGEGQEALRNADLTEAGLKEMTAKVKEALESLKGKQATRDEEETKETRKEQGHLPYGTMIGSLLALLGLLLFLIARRKKESELKKLTKELTKVLQESDLTSVDAKVLDQAREALAQAVAFLANEKESDHTEEELIEKLKAVLAQLR